MLFNLKYYLDLLEIVKLWFDFENNNYYYLLLAPIFPFYSGISLVLDQFWFLTGTADAIYVTEG